MGRSYRSSGSGGTVTLIIGGIILIGCLLIEGGRAIDKGTNFRTEIAAVTDKGVKRKDDTDKYLIYAIDTEGDIQVYEITDSWVAGRFNSSDVYAGIEIGKTYEFTVAGDRNELMSWYPNIYEYEEISEDKEETSHE